MGQKIYYANTKRKQINLAVPENSEIVGELEKEFKSNSYKVGKQKIIKLTGKKLQTILNKYVANSFHTSFIVGLIESDFSISFDIDVEPETKKINRSRQNITMSSHPLITRALQKANITYSVRGQSLKITKQMDCRRFLNSFNPRFFKIYRNDVLLLRKFVVSRSATERVHLMNQYRQCLKE